MLKEKIKQIKNLLEKRSARRKEGLFVVEGPHLVTEALEQIKYAVYSENLSLVKKLEEQRIPCFKISRTQMTELSQVEAPQGILAVVKEKTWKLDDLFEKKDPCLVFCLGLQDPGNLGTIVRTLCAADGAGLLLAKGTVDLYNQKVIRASMGAIFRLPIILAEDDLSMLKQLKKKNVRIIAAEASGGEILYESDLTGPVAILIGNEGAGLPPEILDWADKVIKVPMPGKTESLNAGVAAAVIIYESLRQRICKTK